MELTLFQVDAFAENLFEGNPAAICPLDEWLPDTLLQQIAEENNLSETAYFVQQGSRYHLRWVTPEAEVDLCGHATLAAAHVLFTHLAYAGETIEFETRSGVLLVAKDGRQYRMSFPASKPEPVDTPALLLKALGLESATVLAAFDYMVVVENQQQVEQIAPDFNLLQQLDLRGVVVTAPGDEVDFVSRCFYPKFQIDEDPVTGSAHCETAPYWAQRLGKTALIAKQLSRRTGRVGCEVQEGRVMLSGSAVDFMRGKCLL